MKGWIIGWIILVALVFFLFFKFVVTNVEPGDTTIPKELWEQIEVRKSDSVFENYVRMDIARTSTYVSILTKYQELYLDGTITLSKYNELIEELKKEYNVK